MSLKGRTKIVKTETVETLSAKSKKGADQIKKILSGDKDLLKAFRDSFAEEFSNSYHATKDGKVYLNKKDILSIGVAGANNALKNLDKLGQVEEPVTEDE